MAVNTVQTRDHVGDTLPNTQRCHTLRITVTAVGILNMANDIPFQYYIYL